MFDFKCKYKIHVGAIEDLASVQTYPSVWSSSATRKKLNFCRKFYLFLGTILLSWKYREQLLTLASQLQQTGLWTIRQCCNLDPFLPGVYTVYVDASSDTWFVIQGLIWKRGSQSKRSIGASLQQNSKPCSWAEPGWKTYPNFHHQPQRYSASCGPRWHCVMCQRKYWSVKKEGFHFIAQPNY